MITLEENKLDVNTYLYLRDSANWKTLKEEQAKKALENSLFTLCIYMDGQPKGMGRIVGDGAVICYIQDLVIHPDARGLGLGKKILSRLIEFVKEEQLEDTQMMLDLMCAKGREEFYEGFEFIARPTDNLGPGMIRYLNKE